MAQLMPLPLTVTCFSKIQIGFTFLIPAHLGSPGKGLLNGCVCLQAYLRNYISDLHHRYVLPIYGRDSVLLWRLCDTLCASGFMDDVIFARNGQYGGTSMPLQRVSSLRHRAQDNASATVRPAGCVVSMCQCQSQSKTFNVARLAELLRSPWRRSSHRTTPWVKKIRHLTLAHNLTKYWPLFKILSLSDSVENL